METICNLTTETQLKTPMHTHVIIHGCTTCMKRAYKQGKFLQRLLKCSRVSILLLTSIRDLTQSGTISRLALRNARLPLFQLNILLPLTGSPLLNSVACNLIQKNVNFSSDFIKAQNESNLIFSPS